MSGWIKVEKSLKDDPRIIRMASRLRNADVTLGAKSVTLIIGAIVQLWMYADTHIRQDNTLDLGPGEIDELVCLPGFCDLMPEDWLRKIDENTVELPDFQEHNGVEAKKRAVTQKRVERHRNASSVTSALPDQTRPDQDKDQKRNKTSAPDGAERLRAVVVRPEDVPEKVWDDFLAIRKAKRAPLTQTALDGILREAVKASISLREALEMCCKRGWQGFEAGWVGPAKTTSQRAPPRENFAVIDYGTGGKL